MRTKCPEVGGCPWTETGHFQVMHRGIDVQDKTLYLDLEMKQVAWHHLSSLEDPPPHRMPL